MNKRVLLLSLLSTMLITSCSGNYTFNSNIDKKQIAEYFAPSKVVIYNNEFELPKPYTYAGLVEGQDCQLKPHHAQPNKVNARTEARKLAYKIGANAVIFTGCAVIDSKEAFKNLNSAKVQQCHSMVVCYGKAFTTTEK